MIKRIFLLAALVFALQGARMHSLMESHDGFQVAVSRKDLAFLVQGTRNSGWYAELYAGYVYGTWLFIRKTMRV
ncbi:MAG: hypothetical protein R3C03_07225 [Pirellulaceae bacterium]